MNFKKLTLWSLILLPLILLTSSHAFAQVTLPTVNLGFKTSDNPNEVVNAIKLVLIMTVLTLAPGILIMMTGFTRIIIVLSFLRQAMGVQQMPPNQLLVGLSLFLTFFVMQPAFNEINTKGVQPYLKGTISQEAAIENSLAPLRKFMFNQTRDADLALFVKLSKVEKPKTRAEVPTMVLVPAFVVSELKTAFQIGFIIFLPFLVIDIVASSVLMAMGMMMLPPIVISLPFKIMLFVLVDGWGLLIGSMVKSFG
ncbi:flagellar type III secretion system pore protein FliP [Bdellovibrio sp. HCB185ZH]|uniref:flagellar type III secretion system pore protein FliP n=1 Tax=Bdellovibrio TaxID=958 RepID=UPI001158EA12|nr:MULTISPECIES: flagellar type III secretion system pore protein FliP [unclassified Bdellovibrio]QDK46792.1 flagellar biosynthetic protein FliP [Bdellovibrio sp. ZAP7]QLY24998.1 flagellar type III secretion system pore protein FliP [Bdellovibrio sp. KM01]